MRRRHHLTVKYEIGGIKVETNHAIHAVKKILEDKGLSISTPSSSALKIKLGTGEKLGVIPLLEGCEEPCLLREISIYWASSLDGLSCIGVMAFNSGQKTLYSRACT